MTELFKPEDLVSSYSCAHSPWRGVAMKDVTNSPFATANFDSISFITRVGSALLLARVEALVIADDGSDERALDLYDDACKLVETAAYHHAMGYLDWNPSGFLNIYRELHRIYWDTYDDVRGLS